MGVTCLLLSYLLVQSSLVKGECRIGRSKHARLGPSSTAASGPREAPLVLHSLLLRPTAVIVFRVSSAPSVCSWLNPSKFCDHPKQRHCLHRSVGWYAVLRVEADHTDRSDPVRHAAVTLTTAVFHTRSSQLHVTSAFSGDL